MIEGGGVRRVGAMRRGGGMAFLDLRGGLLNFERILRGGKRNGGVVWLGKSDEEAKRDKLETF